MFSRRSIMALSLSLALAGFARAAARAESSDSAEALIRSLGAEGITLLNNAALPQQQREDQFRQILEKGFDLDTISRLSLGRFWRQATDAQKSDYRTLFEDYIVKSYAARFGQYTGETLNVDGTSTGDDGDSYVKSLISRPNEQPVRVVWRVRKNDTGYRIIDVSVEGVSMMQSQREEFASVIQNNSGQIGALLDQLKSRTAQIK